MNGMRAALWTGATVVAVAASTVGVAVATLTDRDGVVLSQRDVAAQLASDQAAEGQVGSGGDAVAPDSSATATPPDQAPASDPADQPAPVAPGASVIVRSRAGTLAVRCAGDQVTLDRWSPNPGYRADDVTRTATRVSVWFESDTANDVEAVVECAAGRPVLTDNVEVDDHGGGSGRG